MEKEYLLHKSKEESHDEKMLETLKAWIEKNYDIPEVADVQQKYLEAIESWNDEVLRELALRLENYIDYNDQKMRDTREDREYIIQLKEALKFLVGLFMA